MSKTSIMIDDKHYDPNTKKEEALYATMDYNDESLILRCNFIPVELRLTKQAYKKLYTFLKDFGRVE